MIKNVKKRRFGLITVKKVTLPRTPRGGIEKYDGSGAT
jgi:hypothetical protein